MAKKGRKKGPKKGPKKVPKTQAHPPAGPGFLNLPLEVRNMIYRLLLVADKTLGSEVDDFDLGWAEFRDYGLYPEILRVCRQLHFEASPILNGENTFGIQCFGAGFPRKESEVFEGFFGNRFMDTELNALLMNFEIHNTIDAIQRLIPSIDKFQRVEVVIDSGSLGLDGQGFDLIDQCSSTLRNMPALRHITLRSLYNPNCPYNQQLLGPFGTLRNMRSVDIRGPVTKEFSERLKGLMLGNSPQKNAKKMYCLLEKYVDAPKGNTRDLLQASRALQAWDFQRFKALRSKILADAQRRMEDDLLHLYDYDPKSEDQYQAAAVEEKPEHKIAVDYYDSDPENGGIEIRRGHWGM